MPDALGALDVYLTAADYMRTAGLSDEINWQLLSTPESFCESTFLREVAWVVLCSGFREAIVRRVFDYVSLCYCDWESAAAISEAGTVCVSAASSAFGNKAKLNAIIRVAERVEEFGFNTIKANVLRDPIPTLRQFPFVGPVTVWHLAKNLGFNMVKPDRHLVRIAQHFGFEHPNAFCAAISAISGDPVKVVDLIVWRFMADNPAWRYSHLNSTKNART